MPNSIFIPDVLDKRQIWALNFNTDFKFLSPLEDSNYTSLQVVLSQ